MENTTNAKIAGEFRTREKKHIVILGAGFGGLRAALDLGEKIARLKLTDRYEVLLVDQNPYHTYAPTLYEIATTDENLATQLDLKRIVTIDIRKSIGWLPIEFLQAKVVEVDVAGGDIHFESGTRLRFDYLVLALGSQTNYFNIPGLSEHSTTLKTVGDALKLRQRLLQEVEDPERRGLQVVVGGGGSTGVELAAEIKIALSHMDRVACGSCGVDVTIIDGGATVLAPFGERIISLATKRLKRLGISLMNNERIASVDARAVALQSGEKVPFDILVWTGGVAPNALMSTLRMKKDPTGLRPLMTSQMVCLPEGEDLRFYGPIYGIGDAVCFINPRTNRPVPGVARAAIIQGQVVAHNIIEQIKESEGLTKKAALSHYKPFEYPYIIPVGGKFAIARFGPFVFAGLSAWLVKGLVEGNYLFSILPLFSALRLWLKGLWIFMRNDRLG
jgi:NADH dehydrogenase